MGSTPDVPELEEEKRKDRAKRFNIPEASNDAAKMLERAKRFNVSTPELEAEKMAKRAKRFQSTVAATAAVVAAEAPTGTREQDKKALRAFERPCKQLIF